MTHLDILPSSLPFYSESRLIIEPRSAQRTDLAEYLPTLESLVQVKIEGDWAGTVILGSFVENLDTDLEEMANLIACQFAALKCRAAPETSWVIPTPPIRLERGRARLQQIFEDSSRNALFTVFYETKGARTPLFLGIAETKTKARENADA